MHNDESFSRTLGFKLERKKKQEKNYKKYNTQSIIKVEEQKYAYAYQQLWPKSSKHLPHDSKYS